MLVLYLALCAAIAGTHAAPATYDQRQDGDFNVRADVQNVVFLVALPQKMAIPTELLAGFLKSNDKETDIQDRADVHVMEAFVEPSTPYKVEIGSSGRYADGDGRAVEVVIAGRRRAGPEPAAETEGPESPEGPEELKLLGATEQCGPDGERDPVTLACRGRSVPAPPQHADDADEDVKRPEVVPVPA